VIVSFSFKNGVPQPRKIADVGPRLGWIYLQVLDGSTLFFTNSQDTILQTSGAASLQQGLQQVLADRQKGYLWKGEMWALNTIDQGQVDIEIFRDILISALPLDGAPPPPMSTDTFEECDACDDL